MGSESKHLRVAHVSIRNVLGIEDLEFSPGGFTEVTGSNGSGKTSTINALRAALKGGHDATLLRKGANKGEIVLVLDDGTQIKKKITPDNTEVSILRDEKKLSRPAEIIKSLHDTLSVNPIEFLTAPEKSRIDALLQVMPISLEMDRLRQMTAFDPDLIVKVVKSSKVAPEGLDLLQAVRQAVFDDRTGINTKTRDKQGTINQLRATLPEEIAEAPQTDASLLAKLNEIDSQRDKELKRIADKLAGLKTESDDRIAALRVQIADIEKKIVAEQIAFAEIKSMASKGESEARTEHAQSRAGVEAQVKQIEEAQKAAARFEQTRENISRISDEIEVLKADSDKRTESIDSLDAYKSELLASLPIPGLEVIDGKLLRNGIPFDRLNAAQQVGIAVDISKLRAGELGLICVDGLELLDPEHYDAFRTQVAASDLQLIVSKVSAGPLKISGQVAA